MSALLAIARREFQSYFLSPLAYVILTAFLLYNGLTLVGIVEVLNSPGTPRNALMSLLFGSAFFWFMMAVIAAVIAMRLLSEERKSGSLELLLTAPVDESAVVLAKFLGAWLFLIFLWAPTLAYPLMLSRLGSVDWGPVLGGYFGILLIGALYVAAGTFASALTKNQIVSAVLGFLFIMLFLFASVYAQLVNDPKVREVLGYVNLLEHMDDFSRGIIDTRRVVYYVTTVVFFLFLSTKALEANKGR